MKVLLVDAYDSFSHIIDQYLRTRAIASTGRLARETVGEARFAALLVRIAFDANTTRHLAGNILGRQPGVTPERLNRIRDWSTRKAIEGKAYEAWMLGFISSYNAYVFSGSNVVDGIEVDDLRKWVDDYCKEHEQENFDAVVSDNDGCVSEVQVKVANPRSRWVWGAFRLTGSIFHELHRLWHARDCRDEYIGTLVNAYIAAGGQVTASKTGESYVNVGTVNGYHEAVDLLRKRVLLAN